MTGYLITLFALLGLVIGCGQQVPTPPGGDSSIELQTGRSDGEAMTLERVTASPWKLVDPSLLPVEATLASGESLVYRFKADHSGEVLAARSPEATRLVTTFRWAVDWGQRFISLRYAGGRIVDYDAWGDGGAFLLREKAEPQTSYRFERF